MAVVAASTGRAGWTNADAVGARRAHRARILLPTFIFDVFLLNVLTIIIGGHSRGDNKQRDAEAGSL
jgi:hypothetical protein